VVGGVLQRRQQRVRFARYLHFPNDPPRVIHNADARLLDRQHLPLARRRNVLFSGASVAVDVLPSSFNSILIVSRQMQLVFG
jgi:hypothetical protein